MSDFHPENLKPGRRYRVDYRAVGGQMSFTGIFVKMDADKIGDAVVRGEYYPKHSVLWIWFQREDGDGPYNVPTEVEAIIKVTEL